MTVYNKIKSFFSITSFLILISISAGCTSDKEKNKIDVEYLDSLLGLTSGGYYSFSGTIDTDQISTCGEAKADTATTTDFSASATATTTTAYTVTSYYIFELGKSDFTFNYPLGHATMFIKYKYDTKKDSFSLTPATSTTTTCHTTDYIHCNGTDTNPTCETVDSVTCGGTYSFSFVSVQEVTDHPFSDTVAPDILFQGTSGTIDWSGGYSLNSAKDTVVRSNLKLSMSNAEGKIFKADIKCYIPN